MKPIDFAARDFRSLVDPFLLRLREDPGAQALVLFHDDDTEEPVTRARLHAGAMAWAACLHRQGVAAGDVVLIALRHSLPLIQSTWGAFFRGATASLLAAPGPMSAGDLYFHQLAACAGSSGARALVTSADLAPDMKRLLAGSGCRVIVPEMAAPSGPADAGSVITPGCGEEIAYLQFTSGSTGQRKGVQLSHRAILEWIASLIGRQQLFPADVQVSWLPLFHDFGLILGLITPLSLGCLTVLISPFKWLRQPVVQLRAIQRYKAAVSYLPNSGLNHLLRGVPDRDLPSLSLDTLDFLVNGSEPIYYRSQQQFLQRFAPCGFRESALATGYGMAETTLAATMSQRGERSRLDWVDGAVMTRSRRASAASPGSAGAVAMVSSGLPLAGMEVAILDERGRPLAERSIGEIAVRGPALFSGYLGRPDLTRAVLRDGWYASGDLGYLAGGELYVSGRKKDLIIVGGHNIHPEDLEEAAIEGLGIDPGRVVSFGVPDERTGTERIVLVCEPRRSLGQAERLAAEQNLRRRVFAALGLVLGEVRFVERSWIVRTVNGKLARSRCREKYLEETCGRS